jgi:hypothetical protein
MDPIKGESSDSSDKEFVSFLDGSPANFDGKNTMTHHQNDRIVNNLTKNFCSTEEKNQIDYFKSAQSSSKYIHPTT